jgi:MFS family permease
MAGELREMLRNRDYTLFWVGLVFSQIGVRATLAANLYHVFVLSGSTFQTGLVGLSQGVALVLLAPLGGAVADRMDRRRLLQLSQGLSLVFSLSLGLVTVLGVVKTWHILLAVVLNTAAQAFDSPARQSLVPALVPRARLVQAFALIQSSQKTASLVGPALAGLVIALVGPGAVYLFDAATYGVLIVVLALLRVPPQEVRIKASIGRDILEGASFVRKRPIIYQLMALDFSATAFGAYRVLLPVFALEILGVGPTGYGLLSAAPALGALIGAMLMFRLVVQVRAGRLVLASTIAYGLAIIGFAHGRSLAVALVAALLLGLFDALAVAVRHAAVQLETPDAIRGRVSSLYQMGSRSGPALGDMNIGAVAAIVGPVTALTLGGTVPIVAAGAFWLWGTTIADYRVVSPGAADD